MTERCKDREEMSVTEQAEAGYGCCPNCFRKHGNTVIQLDPHDCKNKNGSKHLYFYKVCIVCGEKELFSRIVSRWDNLYIARQGGFNDEDWEEYCAYEECMCSL